MSKNLKKLFTKKFILKRDDLNDDCIRYDVIKIIGEQLNANGIKVNLEKIYNMKTDSESLVLLEKFREKYQQNLKDKWLINLLIELQKECIEKLNYVFKKLPEKYKESIQALEQLVKNYYFSEEVI